MKADLTLGALVRSAAVRGSFEPLAFLQANEARDPSAQVVGLFSELCDEDLTGPPWQWRLKSGPRRDALKMIADKRELTALLGRGPPPSDRDTFGVVLQTLLRQENADRHEGGWFTNAKSLRAIPQQSEALHIALQFAQHVPALNQAELERRFQKVDREVKAFHRVIALNTVLPSKLFGRRHYRQRISRFLRGADNNDDSRPMLVTGIGGMGKSALVAAIASWWNGRKNQPICVFIDFDRPDLSSGSLTHFLMEFTRQFVAALASHEEISDDVVSEVDSYLSREVRRVLRQIVPSESSGEQLHEYELSEISTRIIPILSSGLPEHVRTGRIALFLDSFETVGRYGAAAIRKIAYLESKLREDAGFTGLRTIICGREISLSHGDSGTSLPFINADDSLVDLFGPPERHIRLGALSDQAGGAYLDWLDREEPPIVFRNRAQRERAAGLVSGMPLKLQVLARFAQRHGVGDIDEILDDLDNNADFKAEFAHVFLYERILERIADEDVKTLAHPGLVLRSVTPDLIRLVIADACKLPGVDEARSKALFEGLRNEYWLVEDDGASNALRHRPDLRHEMLPGLFAGARDRPENGLAQQKAELKKKALAVCSAAVDYYQKGPPQSDVGRLAWENIPTDRRRAEALYYRILAGRSFRDPSRIRAEEFVQFVGDDMRNLPVAAQARVHFLRQAHYDINDEMLSTLESNSAAVVRGAQFEARRAFGASGDEAVRPTQASGSGQKGAAKPSRSGKAIKPISLRDTSLFAEIDAAFATGDWSKARVFDEQFEPTDYDDWFSRELANSTWRREGIWASTLWKYVVMTLALGVRKPLVKDRIEAVLPEVASADTGSAYLRLFVNLLASPKRAFDSIESEPSRVELQLHPLTHIDWFRCSATIPNPSWFRASGAQVCPTSALPLATSVFVRLADGDRFVIGEVENALSVLSFQSNSGLQYALRRMSKSRNLTLDDLHQLYRHQEVIEIDYVQGEFSRVADFSRPPPIDDGLVGLTPELHEPTRNLLQRLDDKAAVHCIELAAKSGTYWPDDLVVTARDREQQKKSTKRMKHVYDRDMAATMVESADRCGVLGKLLEHISEVLQVAKPVLNAHRLLSERFALKGAVMSGEEDAPVTRNTSRRKTPRALRSKKRKK